MKPETERMISDILAEAAQAVGWTGRAGIEERVLDAIRRVPREEFVPAHERPLAYDNTPLEIGWGQTVSQPYIVALMTDLADVFPENRVLEVGTGSGYQAAVLSSLAREVVSVEIIPDLAATAASRLARLGFSNVAVQVADGRAGWPAGAPYDAIVVTAAADEIPEALLDQLVEGGRLVIPLDDGSGRQTLVLVEKDHRGDCETHVVLPVRFVPLVRPH